QRLLTAEAALHDDLTAGGGTYFDRPCMRATVDDREDARGAAFLHDRARGNGDDRLRFFRRRNGGLVFEERDLRAHLRLERSVFVQDRHLDLHRRFGAIGGGDDLAQRGAITFVGKRLHRHFRGLLLPKLGYVRLRHV